MTTTVASPLRDDLFRSGYVVVPDVIDPGGVLQPVLDEYAEVLDGLARDLAAAGHPGHEGLLTSGIWHLAGDFAVDEALIYGGYYYMQALARLHESRTTSTHTTHP